MGGKWLEGTENPGVGGSIPPLPTRQKDKGEEIPPFVRQAFEDAAADLPELDPDGEADDAEPAGPAADDTE